MSIDIKVLHIPGDPLILFNIWDAGSAMAVAKSDPKVIATGSWGVAQTQGYDDGEKIPFTHFTRIVRHIIQSVEQPVTVDFETGFSADLGVLRDNTKTLIELGAAGVNFEDRVVEDESMRPIAEQCERIAVLRQTSERLFINARCDLVLDGSGPETHATRIDALVERAKAYANAGADGFFAPGLVTPKLIEELCERSPIPVNITQSSSGNNNTDLANMGVARISYGARPYFALMETLAQQAHDLYQP